MSRASASGGVLCRPRVGAVLSARNGTETRTTPVGAAAPDPVPGSGVVHVSVPRAQDHAANVGQRLDTFREFARRDVVFARSISSNQNVSG